MSYKHSNKCKVCTSQHRIQIEKMKANGMAYRTISDAIFEEHGLKIGHSAIQHHILNHFDPREDALEIVKKESRKLYKENLMDAGQRAAKLSGMMQAAYRYITEHYDELDMKLALQMMFASVDQLNKMEGTGAYAGNDFLKGFQQMLNDIKSGTPVQATIVYEADKDGNADPVDNPVEEMLQNLPNE